MQEATNTPRTGIQDGEDGPGRSGDGDLREQLQEQVDQKTRQAEIKLRDEIERRTSEFGDQLTAMASAMRRGTQDLRGEGKDQAAQLMDRGAEQVDRLGRYLTDADGDRMLGDIEDLGRRRPGMLAAGGLLIGFAAARFLRASSERRRRETEWDAPTLVPTEAAFDDAYGEPLVTGSPSAPTASGPAGTGVVPPPPTVPAGEEATGPSWSGRREEGTR